MTPRTFLRCSTLAIAMAVISACGSGGTVDEGSPSSPAAAARKQQVLALLKSIETGDAAATAAINAGKYIQHNLGVADGLVGFSALLKQLPPGSAKVNTVRVFEEGGFVFAHTDYNFFGPKIGFDIFRFEDGKIVEHWDNLQVKPEALNPGQHSMTDGAVQSRDLAKTDQNKHLVQSFVDDILVNGRMEKLAGYFDGDHYLQHNPQIGDVLSGLSAAFEALAKAGLTIKYDRIHRVLGEGDFVLVMSEGQFAGNHSAFYDLFRVSNGKLAEHWDTIETIPPVSEWKNANGKF
jgi:predicted SnoaL-like aldol condensation-catalyzing enzyme